MFKTHNYALATYKKGGVYTGFIADEKDTTRLSMVPNIIKKHSCRKLTI